MVDSDAEPHERSVGLSVGEAADLLAYLVTSAELCTREPLHYGMFRLIDGASRLLDGMANQAQGEEGEWLLSLKGDIDERKELFMWDRERFEAMLSDVAIRVASSIDEVVDGLRNHSEP